MSFFEPTPEPVPAPTTGPEPEQPPAPAPEPTPHPEPAKAATPPRATGTPLPVTLLLTALLAGGIAYTWLHPHAAPETTPAPDNTALEAKIQSLTTRLDALEKQPTPQIPTAKLDELSGQIAALSARQDALQAALQNHPAEAATPATPPDDSQLKQQIAELTTKLDQTQADQKTTLDQTQAQAEKTQAEEKSALDALQDRLTKLEQGAGAIQGVAQTAERAMRLQAATAALATGQPLGELPDAPPALTRFATIAPPTEASLRSAFPALAEAARAASRPDLDQQSFFSRAIARAEQSITVREGDHVIVGDPATGILARAQTALDHGDFKTALAAIADLHGPAAAPLQNWVEQVKALLAARAALAEMAAHS